METGELLGSLQALMPAVKIPSRGVLSRMVRLHPGTEGAMSLPCNKQATPILEVSADGYMVALVLNADPCDCVVKMASQEKSVSEFTLQQLSGATSKWAHEFWKAVKRGLLYLLVYAGYEDLHPRLTEIIGLYIAAGKNMRTASDSTLPTVQNL